MFRKTIKKRPQMPSMIDFHNFVHCRSQKEKIINNPFQQNWKKAITLDQMLALYKPQQGGIPPSSKTHTKSDYLLQYPLQKRRQNKEEIIWSTNQQSELNKFFKMAEGMTRWEQIFQYNHIQKAAAKIDKTKAGHHHKPKTLSEKQVQKQTNGLKNKKRRQHHFSCSSLAGFTNLIRKSKTALKSQKQQLQRLQKLATKQYGLKFKEKSNLDQIQLNIEEFKKKDEQIIQEFITTLAKPPKEAKKTISQKINSSVPIQIQPKKPFPYISEESPLGEIHLPKSAHCSSKKQYLRIECD